jgi:hypothetical protein
MGRLTKYYKKSTIKLADCISAAHNQQFVLSSSVSIDIYTVFGRLVYMELVA